MVNRRGASKAAKAEKEVSPMANAEPTTELREGDISVNMDTKLVFNVSIPAGLRVAIDKAAKEADTDAVSFAREVLAKAVKYDRPLGAGRRAAKYGSEEEKKAAQALRNAAKRNLVKNLLSQYMEDDDDDDDDD